MTVDGESGPGRLRREAILWLTAFILSLAQWRHIAFFFDRDFTRAVQAAQGVLDGYPHWRYFQSRLLGPWAVKLVASDGFNFGIAHIIVSVAVLTATSVMMFSVGQRIAGRQGGWSALLAFHLLFLLMMSRPWLYIWDYFLLLIEATFLWLVVRRAPWWSFLLLMGVAYINHESAAFIGVWMAAQAMADAWFERRPLNWRLLVGGVAGVLAGQALQEHLRNSLLKREIGWEIFSDVGKGPSSPLDAYLHVQLSANWQDIQQWVTDPNVYLMFLIPLTLIAAFALAVALVVRHGVKAAGLATTVVAQIIALLLFGMRSETRDLLQLLPFLAIGGMLAAKKAWD